MGYFPTKQNVTIERGIGELDIYGKQTYSSLRQLKCRAVEGSHITVDRDSQVNGATIVCDLKLLFDKLADITYSDHITYTNELGTVFAGKAKKIKIQRDFAGKPVLTEVLV